MFSFIDSRFLRTIFCHPIMPEDAFTDESVVRKAPRSDPDSIGSRPILMLLLPSE